MKHVFVDTSAWYAYVRRDDPDHNAVKKVIEDWQGRLVSSNFVFDEVVTLAKTRMGHSIAIRVGKILNDPEVVELIRILPEDEENAWAFFMHHSDKYYSFTDCTSFVLMRRLNIQTAIATDRHFHQSGFQIQPVI